MTTDGGFWAGEHLKKLKRYDIPLAMPAEAFCSQGLFSQLKILPLKYGEGISRELMDRAKLSCKNAIRNGTVSGTALLFAIQYSSKNIFMCGLDMAAQKGFQHTQPNELEANSAQKDFRLSTKEGREEILKRAKDVADKAKESVIYTAQRGTSATKKAANQTIRIAHAKSEKIKTTIKVVFEVKND